MSDVKRLLDDLHPVIEESGSVWHAAYCGGCSRIFRRVPYPCPTMRAVDALIADYEAAVDALEDLIGYAATPALWAADHDPEPVQYARAALRRLRGDTR